jgi:hypothetical protein
MDEDPVVKFDPEWIYGDDEPNPGLVVCVITGSILGLTFALIVTLIEWLT